MDNIEHAISLLRKGKKAVDVAAATGLMKWKVLEIRQKNKITVSPKRGKDKSKMFRNSKGNLDYKSKYKEFQDRSEYNGF